MDEATYDRRIKHTNKFYMQLISALIDGVTAGLSRKDFVDALNHREIRSPTGANWNQNSLTLTLRSLHSSYEPGSYIRTAMHSLTFDGLLSRAQCLCLLSAAKPDRM